MDSRNSNLLFVRLATLVPEEFPSIFPSAPCATVPNAAVSPRDIFNLYQKGVNVPSLQAVSEPSREGHFITPTDPMQALQLANEFMAIQPTLPVPSSEVSPEPLTPSVDSPSTSAAE